MKKVVGFILVFFLFSNIFAWRHNQIGALLEMLELFWENRDGAAFFTSHDAIIELMLINPEETLTWLERNEKISNELFSEWHRTVFKDGTGEMPISCFINLKNKLIKSLENIHFSEIKKDNFRLKFLFELKKIIIKDKT